MQHGCIQADAKKCAGSHHSGAWLNWKIDRCRAARRERARSRQPRIRNSRPRRFPASVITWH